VAPYGLAQRRKGAKMLREEFLTQRHKDTKGCEECHSQHWLVVPHGMGVRPGNICF
jgi:hypothetical protein